MTQQGNGIRGSTLIVVIAGAVVTYSGITGKSITTTLRSFLSGDSPTDDAQITPIAMGGMGGGPSVGVSAGISETPTPNNSSAAANQRIAKLYATTYGWSVGQQWDALVKLWQQESEWSNTVANGTSGAYGIPQALPYTKMPKPAWPPSAGGRASAVTQIIWGLQYIKGRYGNPVAAWAHEQREGWY